MVAGFAVLLTIRKHGGLSQVVWRRGEAFKRKEQPQNCEDIHPFIVVNGGVPVTDIMEGAGQPGLAVGLLHLPPPARLQQQEKK